MFLSGIQKIKLPIILITLGVLVFGFFCTGIFHKAPMAMAGMETHITPSHILQPCCNNGLSQHFALSGNTFLAISHDLRNFLLSIALGLILTFFFIQSSIHQLFERSKIISYKLYIRNHLDVPSHSLQYAFARGILNPKVY